MAFFATVEGLPLARKQWGGGPRNNPNPKVPNPPVRPPRGNPPIDKRPRHSCEQGGIPMIVPIGGGNREWRCSPVPYAYVSIGYTADQIRGWPKPRVIPRAVTGDKTYKPRRRVGFVKATAKSHINENVEDN